MLLNINSELIYIYIYKNSTDFSEVLEKKFREECGYKSLRPIKIGS